MADKDEELRKLIAERNKEIDELYAEIRVLERYPADTGASRALVAKRRRLEALHAECAELMREYFNLNIPLESGAVTAMVQKSEKLLDNSDQLDEDSARFLSKMAELSEKEMNILRVGDRVADWFQNRVNLSGFLLSWFWTILGVCFLFLVFLPLFYVVDAVFRLVEWRYSRVLERAKKKAKHR